MIAVVKLNGQIATIFVKLNCAEKIPNINNSDPSNLLFGTLTGLFVKIAR